jgi:hypothetical protein
MKDCAGDKLTTSWKFPEIFMYPVVDIGGGTCLLMTSLPRNMKKKK